MINFSPKIYLKRIVGGQAWVGCIAWFVNVTCLTFVQRLHLRRKADGQAWLGNGCIDWFDNLKLGI